MVKRISMKEIAVKAGVSVAAVSYVINGKGKVSDDTKKRIEKIIDELDYSVDTYAQTLAKKRSNVIGITLPIIETDNKKESLLGRNPFFAEYLSGINNIISESKYDILITEININSQYKNWIKGRRIDGVILLGVYPDDIYDDIHKLGVPAVCCDVYDPKADLACVRSDDEIGSYKATKHLIDLGHSRIAFVSGSKKTSPINAMRYAGYSKALEDANIEVDETIVYETLMSFESGYQLGFKLPIAELSGIVCAADIVALGIMKSLYEQNIDVPKQLSIVGFDDIQYAHYMSLGLTTVRQQIVKKGEIAASLLLDIMEKGNSAKKQIIIPTELIVRGSTTAKKEE